MNDWTEMNEKNYNSLQSCQISIINGNQSVDDIVSARFFQYLKKNKSFISNNLKQFTFETSNNEVDSSDKSRLIEVI